MGHNQHFWLLLLLPGTVLISIHLFELEPILGYSWVFGIALGCVLQRSNFCFACAFRDLFIFGSTQMAKAILLLLGLSILGFSFVQHQAAVIAAEIPGKIHPLTLGTGIGAFLFGLGMVLAGGCACGVLVRLGEGFSQFFAVMAGLIAGSVVGSWHYGWWQAIYYHAPVFLPAHLGWERALLLQLGVLGALYLSIKSFETRAKRASLQRWEKL